MRKSENKREVPRDGAREREGRVIVRNSEKEREGVRKSENELKVPRDSAR